MSSPKSKPDHDLQRIRVNADGYDSTDAYWGAGPDVFIATSCAGDDQITVRARTIKEARQKIAGEIARQPDQKRASDDKLGGNAPRKTRYEIAWINPLTSQTVKIRITHSRDYLASGTDHIEIESIAPKKASLPMTETGYRSHFMPPLDLMNAGGPVTFVTAWLEQEAKGMAWTKAVTAKAQGDLFNWAEAQGEVGPRKRSPKGNAKTANRQDGKPPRRRKPARDPS